MMAEGMETGWDRFISLIIGRQEGYRLDDRTSGTLLVAITGGTQSAYPWSAIIELASVKQLSGC